MSENNQPDITTLTVQLVSAFVSNNNVASEGLADLIRTTRLALTDDLAAKPEDAAAPTYTPAVSVRKSLSSPEHILSMIDGRPRSEEHTSELQSLMRISYAVFCLKKKKKQNQ